MKLCNTLLFGVINVFLCTTVFGCSEVAETFTPEVQNKVSEYVTIRTNIQCEIRKTSMPEFTKGNIDLLNQALKKIDELKSIDSAEISNMIFLDEIVIKQMLEKTLENKE